MLFWKRSALYDRTNQNEIIVGLVLKKNRSSFQNKTLGSCLADADGFYWLWNRSSTRSYEGHFELNTGNYCVEISGSGFPVERL